MARPKLTRRDFQRLFRLAGRLMLESGTVNTGQLNDSELSEKVFDYLDYLHASPLRITTDHRGELLRAARQFKSSKEFPIAILLAATWIEHWINGFIVKQTSHLSNAHRNEMLRTVPLHGKLTWFLALLNAKPISAIRVRSIRQLADERNAFVHYKWLETDIDAPTAKESDRLARIFAEFEKTVRYLRAYDRSNMRGVDRRRIGKLAARIPALPRS